MRWTYQLSILNNLHNIYMIWYSINTQSYYGSSTKYVRKIFQKTNISNPLMRIRTCAYKGVRNVSFLKNFAYILYGRSLMIEIFRARPGFGKRICQD